MDTIVYIHHAFVSLLLIFQIYMYHVCVSTVKFCRHCNYMYTLSCCNCLCCSLDTNISLNIPYSGKFSRNDSRSLQKKFSRFNAKKPHPPQALHVKYRCVGVSPSFNFRVDCSALKKRENFPLYVWSNVYFHC